MIRVTPSERIAVISEIGRILAQQDWPLIDLTLRQFGLSTTDGWERDKTSYVIWMIDDAPDEKLSDLATHLHIPLSAGIEQPADLPFWEPEHLRLFVSHVNTFKLLAENIKTNLRQYKISAFVAHSDIEPTREWLEQIEGALTTADALLAMLTTDFHDSLWTDQEVGVALGRQIPVIPLRLGQDPYGLFGKFQGLPGSGRKTDEIARSIAESLGKNATTSKRMTFALVGALADSQSYDASRRIMTLLEKVDYLDSSLAEKMRNSIMANSQVKSAYGVPERIDTLITRRGLE
jgi:hypothetical protein